MVDDGSTDDTATAVARYADRGVRYVYQENRGPGPARNLGLAVTSGEVVAFCDADDVWMPEKLAVQVAHLERHPEIALVSAHTYACDEALRPMSLVHTARGESVDIFEALLVRNVVLNPTCVVARRSALVVVGGFSDLPRWEDWDTWLSVAEQFPVGFVDQPVAYVRRHDASLSPVDGAARLALDARILERHIARVPSRRRRTFIRVRARSNAYFHAATTTAGAGSPARVRREALLALLLDPFTLTRRKVVLVCRTWMPATHTRLRTFAGRSWTAL